MSGICLLGKSEMTFKDPDRGNRLRGASKVVKTLDLDFQNLLNNKSSWASKEETLRFLEDHSPFMRWLERLSLDKEFIQNKDLILQALTHSSYIHENKGWSFGHNERLEFLGDAVLDLELSHILWRVFPDLNEGELSRFRSSLVNENTLAQWAQALGLEGFLFLGKGESNKDIVEPAILADGFEALLGAVSLINKERPQALLLKWIELFNEHYMPGEPAFLDIVRLQLFDPKTRLQEMTLELFKEIPKYVCHDLGEEFSCQVSLQGKVLGKGTGSSKKKAEIAAARAALIEEKEFLKINN